MIATIPFDPQGANADTLINLLELADGRVGYRDALVVHAMARLTTVVERLVLARAVRLFAEDRVFLNRQRTVVFG